MFKKPEGITPEKLAKALKANRPPQAPPPPPPSSSPPPQQSRSQGPDIIGAAVWAYGQWNNYQKQLDEQERALLDLAHQNKGWFTQAEATRLLGRATQATIDRLKEAGIVEEMSGKHGQPVYVVPQFIPPSVTCAYCQAIYEPGEAQNCRQCGAVLNAP